MKRGSVLDGADAGECRAKLKREMDSLLFETN